uniref:Uncharacterized protein n=1 Tax=Oryza brachyantha TaxID=4533 RepID=J3N183_ORYBR
WRCIFLPEFRYLYRPASNITAQHVYMTRTLADFFSELRQGYMKQHVHAEIHGATSTKQRTKYWTK